MSYQPKLLEELFTSQDNVPKKGPLVAEIDNENEETNQDKMTKNDIEDGVYIPSSSSSCNTQDQEGPSMMELMMQAQREAQASKDKAKYEEEKRATKTFAGGFKKGFFGSNSSSNTDKKKTKVSSSSSSSPPPPPSAPSTSSSSSIPTIEKKSKAANGGEGNKNRNLMMEEVQEAMKQDTNPMLAQLKQGDWVTPDLESQLKSNMIFQNGLKNPKCIQAMQVDRLS